MEEKEKEEEEEFINSDEYEKLASTALQEGSVNVASVYAQLSIAAALRETSFILIEAMGMSSDEEE